MSKHFKKFINPVLTTFVLALVLTVFGPPGVASAQETAGEIAPARPLSITLSSNVIDVKMKTLRIHGAGFTPGSIVTVGIPGLPSNKGFTKARDVWFGVVTVNKYQAFSVSVNLKRTLWRLKGVLAKEAGTSGGIYTLMAKNDLDEVATAPLVINLKKGKEKTRKKGK